MGAVLAYIGQLYAVEKRARRSGIEGDRLACYAKQASRPVLDQLHAYLLKIRDELLPKSEAGSGGRLCSEELGRTDALLATMAIYPSTTTTPSARLRGIAVGRNNWVFLGSDRGGKTMAILRSFVASCELVKVDPFVWFRDVLGRIATYSIQKLDELLPHRWAPVRQ